MTGVRPLHQATVSASVPTPARRRRAPAAALIGTTSFLQFGHLHGALVDEDAWFDRAMAVAAEGVGLELPLG